MRWLSYIAISMLLASCGDNLVEECDKNIDAGADVILVATTRIVDHFEGFAKNKKAIRPYYNQAKKSEVIVRGIEVFSDKIFYQLLDTQLKYLEDYESKWMDKKLPDTNRKFIKLFIAFNHYHYVNQLAKNLSCSHCYYYRKQAYHYYGPIQFDYQAPYLYAYEIITYPYDSISININQLMYQVDTIVDSITQIPLYLPREVKGVKAVRILLPNIKNKVLNTRYLIQEHGYIDTLNFEYELKHYAK